VLPGYRAEKTTDIWNTAKQELQQGSQIPAEAKAAEAFLDEQKYPLSRDQRLKSIRATAYLREATHVKPYSKGLAVRTLKRHKQAPFENSSPS